MPPTPAYEALVAVGTVYRSARPDADLRPVREWLCALLEVDRVAVDEAIADVNRVITAYRADLEVAVAAGVGPLSAEGTALRLAREDIECARTTLRLLGVPFDRLPTADLDAFGREHLNTPFPGEDGQGHTDPERLWDLWHDPLAWWSAYGNTMPDPDAYADTTADA